MKLRVLGKSPSWCDAGGASSSYLVTHDGTAVIVDLGYGAFPKLRLFRDYCAIDAIVVSHMHADHFFDVVPYSYALKYAPRQQPVPVDRFEGVAEPWRPRLFVPTGGTEMLRTITGLWGQPSLVTDAFEVAEYDASHAIVVGSLRFRFCAVPHFVTTHAIEISSTSTERRIVYGADHRPNDAVSAFARDADLLLMESTLPRPERTGVRGHMTPEEAGEHARKARAKRLVLTHLSDELDPLAILKRAARFYGGPVAMAREGDLYTV